MSDGAERPWRVLDVTGTTCAESMARIPVVCANVASGKSSDVFIVGTFGTRHFNVGWFDDVDEVVDLDACEAEGVEVVRRMVFGGGTAYYDSDATLVASQMVHASRYDSLDAALDAWQPIVIDAVSRLGLEGATFEGSSDLRWGGRKLGSFVANEVFGALQVGGFMNLRRPDMDVYARCARVPEEKFRDKLVKDHLAYIVTPEEIRGSPIGYAEAKEAFLGALRDATGRDAEESEGTDDELAGTKDFVAMMTSPEQLHRVSSRRFLAEAPSGTRAGAAFRKARKLVRAAVIVDDAGRIGSALLAGDMLVAPPDTIDKAAAALTGVDAGDAAAIEAAIAGVLDAPDVSQADEHLGVTAADLAATVVLAVEAAEVVP